jgi:tetratricopeptide (TPR) repeat protein/CHAT domain-containing protein
MNATRPTTLLVVLAGLALAAAPPPRLTHAQTEQLRQRSQWLQRANAHHRAGEIDQTIAALHKGLALERSLFGHLRADSLRWLASQAELQVQRERFAEAIEARQEVLRRREDLHGPDDWRVTDARLDLEDTRRLARLDARQRQHLRQARQWNSQVFRLWQQGRSKEALPIAEKVLQTRRDLLGPKHRLTALSWFNLGAQHAALHRVEDARRCYQQALRINKEVLGEKHPGYAQSLNNLAALYQDMGEHRLALPLYQRALRICQEVLGEKHLDYALSLNNLAGLYKDRGEHRLALPLLRRALRISSEVQGEKHPDHASTLNNLAVLYVEMGEHRQALPLYQQALRISREVQGEKHPDYASSLNNLAGLYQDMGEYRQALPLFQQALRITREVHGEKHPAYATRLNNLAWLYKDMGEYRLALPLFRQALRVRQEVQGEKHPLYANSLKGLAWMFVEMGEHRLALPLFQQALRIHKEALGEKHTDYATSLNHLALLYAEMREYRLALPLFQQALRIRQEVLGEKHPDCASSLNNLALLYRATGKQGASLVLSGQALAVIQAHLRDSLAVLSDRQRQLLLEQRAHYLEFFLSGAIGTVPEAMLYEQVAVFKDVTSTAIAEQHLARHNPRLRSLLGELRDVRTQLARQGGQQASARNLSRWRQRFDEIDRRKTDLEQQLARASAEFSHLHDKPTAGRITARLPPRTALVEFLCYRRALRPGTRGWQWEDRLIAFVLRPDCEPVLVELGDPRLLHSAVRLWGQTVRAGNRPDRLAAQLLRQRLWQPIERHLDGIDMVLIAPDGELAGLPFAALPGSRPGSFLIEQYTFGYLNSGRQLLLPSLAVEGAGLLVLGGADFGTPQQTTEPLQRPRHWPALPGAELEARQVPGAFRRRFEKPSVVVLQGKQADREGLLSALQRRPWRYLHVATHGHFDPPRQALPPAVLGAWSVGAAAGPGLAGRSGSLTAALLAQEPGTLNRERGFDPSGQRYRVQEGNPMLLCSLVLAGVNDTGEPGYLSAEEIALLDLTGCELGVLSACDTGLGQQAGWQGVQGLQRGFHQAGARHVLASLWSVSDPATSVLMEEFYRHLWEKKLPPVQALRQAQLFVLRHPERVLQRDRELVKRLADSKTSPTLLAQRGIGRKAKQGIPRPGVGKRSPVAWWAPWVLSGNAGR